MSCSLTCIAILGSWVAPLPIDTIVSRQSCPIAPRGGVLMVQLFAEESSDQWPSTLTVTFENGHVAIGVLGWVEKNKDTSKWANSHSYIRPIASTDNTLNIHPKDANTGPVLLVELPLDGNGIIRFGGDAIVPRWVDLPPSLPSLDLTPIDETNILSTETHDDTPEWNPLEYWRWTLFASRMGAVPPDPPNYSTVSRLAALHGAQLWRIGFDRIARSSRGVAAACRDLLTNTALDGTHSFACWVIQPDPLHQLLTILLDENASSRQLASRVLRWVEDQQPHVLWIEQVFGPHISIAIANPTLETTIATMLWQTKDDIPLAMEIPPRQTTRMHVQRMPDIDLSIFGPVTTQDTVQWLLVSMGNQTASLPIVPRDVLAMPPSVQLQTLHPLWNLKNVQSGRPDSVALALRTTVQVRKLLGQWELFIQCAGVADSDPLPAVIDAPCDLQGFEAITILHPKTGAMICISPEGVERRYAIPGDLQVMTSVNEHHWSARVVLPKAWVVDDELSFSIVRTHGDSMQVETGPLPCVPWAINPSPILIDLSGWDEIHGFPTQLPIK